jgi:fatty acid desaturase
MVNGFHELVHRTVFKSRALNEVFLRVLSFLGWLNPHLFYASHMKHHRYTLHPPKDGEVVLPISFTLKDYLLNAFVTPRGLYGIVRGTVRHAVGKLNNQWEEAIFPEDDPESRRKLVQWARILLLGHGAIVALSVAMGWWMLPLLVTLAPFYGRWLHVACNQTQHIGLVDDVDDYRLCCRTFAVNPVVRFVYWHMNYHTEHHMYAAVPCYNLHRAHKLVRHNLPPVPRGLIQTWREIGAILRKQRENPDYRYVAPVPPRLDG